jgi:hypothetical protein
LPDIGSHFSLATFEAGMQADPRILGMLYLGSQGRGAMDRYSDLDIDIWVSGDAWGAAGETLHAILGRLGAEQFSYARGPAAITGFVGPEWQRVDLSLHGPNDTKVHAEYAGGRVIKDATGFLTRLVERAPHEKIETSLHDARQVVEEAVDSMIYLTLHNARGAHWSAAGEVSGQLQSLYTLLARLRGVESHGFRAVEQVLSAEEQTLLARAWPVRIDRAEVRRAAGALWDWTCHVWREAERALEGSLEIALDQKAMLRAIDRIYAGGE